MGLRYPGRSAEDIADQIINQSDEGIDDLLVDTEVYDDDDDFDDFPSSFESDLDFDDSDPDY